MDNSLKAYEGVTQALSYLADQTYSPAQIEALGIYLADLSKSMDDLDVNKHFMHQKEIIEKLDVLFTFAHQHQSEQALIQNLYVEIDNLLAQLCGLQGGSVSF